MKRLLEKALAAGAQEAEILRAADIVVADWVALKCRYGCPVYGRSWTCPPRSPTPVETRRVLAEYGSALAVRIGATGEAAARDAWRAMNSLVVDLEREAFLAGFRKAFALGGGRCIWCEECDTSSPCQHPRQARPSMEACGIDVKSTMQAAGWEYAVAAGRESNIQWFGLVLLE